eukprot:133246_1
MPRTPSLKRTWALMNFKKLDFRQREVDFEIRMNSTAIANTGSVLTKYILSNRPQLFNSDYLQYTASGFLSLQHAVDSYLLDEAPFSHYFKTPVMTAPFPTTAFDENPFFWNVGCTYEACLADKNLELEGRVLDQKAAVPRSEQGSGFT